jgi:hypothetical protein
VQEVTARKAVALEASIGCKTVAIADQASARFAALGHLAHLPGRLIFRLAAPISSSIELPHGFRDPAGLFFCKNAIVAASMRCLVSLRDSQ